MARLPRLAIAGELHLVVQRGHNRQPVFADDVDRRTCLDALHAVLPAHGVSLHGYALVDSEIWLLVQPAADGALSRAMQALGRRYVAAYNRRHGRSGTLWDGRFHASVIDAESQLLDALIHLESKPVDAGLVPTAADWPWSSAAHHLGRRRDLLLAEHPRLWALGNTPFERETAYRRRLEAGLTARRRQAFDDAALRGWALGPQAFLQRVAGSVERPLVRRARGRPPKQTGGAGARRSGDV